MNIVINNTSEISLEKLLEYKENNSNFSFIIKDENKYEDKSQSYSLDTMIALKKKITEIINPVKDKYNGPDKEKKIFTYLYTKLAYHIDYDERASESCSLSGYDYDASEHLRTKASNLVGGLLNRKSICSGYSEILRNILAEVGIDCLYISGRNGIGRTGGSHAWNQVKLDGKWYNVDLTNDRDKIVEGRECKHFLKSNKNFTRYEKYEVKSDRLENCEEDVPNPEELLEECQYVPTTPKDIAKGTESKGIFTREISNIKNFFNRFLNISKER